MSNEEERRKKVLLAFAECAANPESFDPSEIVNKLIEAAAIPEREYSVTLDGRQLKAIMEFAYPNGDQEELDLEEQVSIGVGEITDDDGASTHGLRCWFTDIPGEGCLPL